MQWFAFLAELTSVVVLWLRGRALLLAALFWMGFHVFTVTILYIHFAPTLICWLAFAPLERLGPWARRVKPAGAAASAGHPGDQRRPASDPAVRRRPYAPRNRASRRGAVPAGAAGLTQTLGSSTGARGGGYTRPWQGGSTRKTSPPYVTGLGSRR